MALPLPENILGLSAAYAGPRTIHDLSDSKLLAPDGVQTAWTEYRLWLQKHSASFTGQLFSSIQASHPELPLADLLETTDRCARRILQRDSHDLFLNLDPVSPFHFDEMNKEAELLRDSEKIKEKKIINMLKARHPRIFSHVIFSRSIDAIRYGLTFTEFIDYGLDGALRLCVMFGQLDCVQAILDSRYQLVLLNVEICFKLAIEHFYPNCLKALVQSGHRIDCGYYGELISLSIFRCDLDSLKILLGNERLAEVPTEDLESALYTAAERGSLPCLRELLHCERKFPNNILSAAADRAKAAGHDDCAKAVEAAFSLEESPCAIM